jgi:hypothetical protein
MTKERWFALMIALFGLVCFAYPFLPAPPTNRLADTIVANGAFLLMGIFCEVVVWVCWVD